MNHDFIIENNVFKNYMGHDKEVIIPDGIECIGQYAFSHCQSVTNIRIPDSVTKISTRAFDCCENLKTLHIPDSITQIGKYAFHYCKNLESITIPDKVTKIGDAAFWRCDSLQSINIPARMKQIGFVAFLNCPSLSNIHVSEQNKNYTSIDGVLFNKEQTTLICFPEHHPQKEYIIPDSVTKIEIRAFDNCNHLTGITIPDSVTEIESGAFSCCTSLLNVHIPDNVKWTKNHVSGYTNLTFPNSPVQIKDDNDILKMAVTKDYSSRMELSEKYPFLWNVFCSAPEEETIFSYVKKNLSKMFTFLIDENKTEIIQKVLADGRLITKRNIDKFIQYAIEKQFHEIYLLLLEYKNQHIGYQDITEKLKL